MVRQYVTYRETSLHVLNHNINQSLLQKL